MSSPNDGAGGFGGDAGAPRAGGAFPATRHSVIHAAGSADPDTRARALETLATSYWLPVYKYLRVRWRLEREDAEDLTQEFFARALAREVFARYDPARGRFRTFLRVCLDGVAANERKAAQRLKRGGDQRFVSLDFAGAEGELARAEAADAADPDEYFRREWVRALFAAAVDAFRQQCEESGKQTYFALFERYDLADDAAGDRPTYADLARVHGLPVTQVTNFLAWARREFRAHVLARVRETAASDEEYRADVREILGADGV